MGILDNKSRIIDAVVTQEGRRQLASGKLKVEYYSFTDVGTYYTGSVDTGSADATTRISFEQPTGLPQDQITFEADDSGRLRSFRGVLDAEISGGRLISYSFDAASSTLLTGSQVASFVSGDEFASTTSELIQGSIDNLRNLYIVGSQNPFFDDEGFDVGILNNRSRTDDSTIIFTINDDGPIRHVDNRNANINTTESLFADRRLSHIDNFAFLPPIIKSNDLTKQQKSDFEVTRPDYASEGIEAPLERWLGNYIPLGDIKQQTPEELHAELDALMLAGHSAGLRVDPTSGENNLILQAFEIGNDIIKKLDVIDRGTYNHKGMFHRTFFLGKVVVDDNQTHTFVHLFTLVFGG